MPHRLSARALRLPAFWAATATLLLPATACVRVERLGPHRFALTDSSYSRLADQAQRLCPYGYDRGPVSSSTKEMSSTANMTNYSGPAMAGPRSTTPINMSFGTSTVETWTVTCKPANKPECSMNFWNQKKRLPSSCYGEPTAEDLAEDQAQAEAAKEEQRREEQRRKGDTARRIDVKPAAKQPPSPKLEPAAKQPPSPKLEPAAKQPPSPKLEPPPPSRVESRPAAPVADTPAGPDSIALEIGNLVGRWRGTILKEHYLDIRSDGSFHVEFIADDGAKRSGDGRIELRGNRTLTLLYSATDARSSVDPQTVADVHVSRTTLTWNNAGMTQVWRR